MGKADSGKLKISHVAKAQNSKCQAVHAIFGNRLRQLLALVSLGNQYRKVEDE